MNYDRIIMELLERIELLEERVSQLEMSKTEQSNPNIKVSKKYRYLSNFLKSSNQQSIKLSFSEIENILKFSLPNSAKKYREFWSNSETHSIALSWLSVGYKTVDVNIYRNEISFEKQSF